MEAEVKTPGRPLRVWFYPRRAYVSVVASDVSSKEVLTYVLISPLADEPLISDMLAEELECDVR